MDGALSHREDIKLILRQLVHAFSSSCTDDFNLLFSLFRWCCRPFDGVLIAWVSVLGVCPSR